jgi:anti-sigma factor RsiW
MNCTLFKSAIIAFQEGSLPEEAMNAARHHLASCMSCSRLVSEFREIDTIIAWEKSTEPNPFTATRILQRIENKYTEPGKSAIQAWVRMLQPVALAVAMLCGILLGTYTAKKDSTAAMKSPGTSDNIEFLRSNLFISEFTGDDKVLVLNK